MKKTRLNSMVFIVIGCIPLVLILIFTGVYAAIMNTVVTTIAVIFAGLVLGAVGWILLWHCHDIVFEDVLTYCMDCNESFKQSEIKKQVEHVYGKMYVSYRCPCCDSFISH